MTVRTSYCCVTITLAVFTPQLFPDEQELKGLEALEYQMARNLEALKHRREYARFSESFKGTLFNWGGRLFAVYCVFRVISVSPNFLWKRSAMVKFSNSPSSIS